MHMELLDSFHGARDDHHVAKPTPTRTFQRKTSFKEIQSAISRIKPEVLKSVIVAASAGFTAKPNAITAVPSPAARAAPKCLDAEKAPLTIFYSGKVVVVDLPPHKAESILQLAEKGSAGDGIGEPTAAGDLEDYDKIISKIDGGDLPIARRRSLQRFLQRRMKRLVTPTAYKKGTKKPIIWHGGVVKT